MSAETARNDAVRKSQGLQHATPRGGDGSHGTGNTNLGTERSVEGDDVGVVEARQQLALGPDRFPHVGVAVCHVDDLFWHGGRWVGGGKIGSDSHDRTSRRRLKV